ncbi:DUF305 domain-containing protein [Roseomonas sp. E05]|uniref:DUF305 domain-containing protein n=1 Tax=Roseomonas sp. E05 TaxID=3046310 RepID=UPI0024B8A1B0|nr:DUF305 domain-containing protein [Roseomonas sp. E05]MDJ0390440.1 DUF305 domain-containing protein [Roseomonas sp. E05]
MKRMASMGFAAVLAVALNAAPTRAEHGDVGRYYDAGREDDTAPITTTWWDVLPREEADAAIAADRHYIEGMRPHHAGALTLAKGYLADPEARNPVLRRLAGSILRNQAFEILLLDTVGEQVRQPPVPLFGGLVLRPVAVEGLGQSRRILHTPGPGPLALLNGGAPTTETDLRFAKEMRVHHAAAVRMARNYNAGAEARNNFLRLMNVNIVTDQTQEIAIMDRVLAAHPRRAAAITVDPASIPGMEHMMGGK